MDKKSTKSRRAVILIVVLLVLVVGLAAVVAFNYDNIKAIYRGLTTNPEDIVHLDEQNKKDTASALNNVGINVNEEDFNKVNDGTLSQEEIAEILLNSMKHENASGESLSESENAENNPSQNPETGDSVQKPPETDSSVGDDSSSEKQPTASIDVPDKNPPQNAGAGTPQTEPDTSKPPVQQTTPADQIPQPPVTQPPITTVTPGENGQTSAGKLTDEEYNKQVADLVAKIYVIKSNFLSTLSGFESTIISQYKALPAEQRTAATKAKIVADNMAYVTGLEAQCDAQVKAVTDELTALMTQNGKPTDLVDAINTAYANEKELKKAYYISLYK